MKDWQFLITGASSGIGFAIAQDLVARGATVHITGRRENALQEAKELLGDRVFIYPSDMSSWADQEKLLASLNIHTNGRLDGVIINAAKYGFESVLDISQQALQAYFQTNCLSSVWLMQRVAPLLESGVGKSMVLISSTLSTRPISGTAAYAASKAALNVFAQSFAIELAPKGIRCNAVLPGVVDTPIHEPQRPEDPTREVKMAQLGPMHPLGRVGRPEDVARTVVFLLSPASRWTTGALFPVDGGISLV